MGTPQRYTDNYQRYKKQGGLLQPETLIDDFVAHNEGNREDLHRFYFFCLTFDLLAKEGITGDIAELGVYKGSTATLLARMARLLGTTAYLLDTFAGFDTRDVSGIDRGKRMEFADTTIEMVRSRVGRANVEIIEGRFPETASRIPDKARFCLVHLDCDLYAPTAAALTFFYPRMVPGGFLIIHDYLSLHWEGVERATDEFFSDKPESIVPLPDSAGSVAVRKLRVGHQFNNWYVQARSAGFANMWLHAAYDGLADFLDQGWSSEEDWGVWGIGACHTLRLIPSAAPKANFILEADVQVVLLGERTSQLVDVVAGGDKLATWEFTLERNRGVRTVQVPVAELAAANGLPGTLIGFLPRSVAAPHDLDPSNSDTRQLGMGLIRLRQRFQD